MIRPFVMSLAVAFAIVATPASSKTRMIVLAPDATPSKDALFKEIVETVAALTPGERLLVYSARPVGQIASIEFPNTAGMTQARINAALAAQLRPLKAYLAAPPTTAAPELPGQLGLPSLFDELGRNVLPALPDQDVHVALVGSLLHLDPRDGRSMMLGTRLVPSDGVLRAPRSEWIFSVAGAQTRLSQKTVHFCTPNAASEYESASHEDAVRRFWSLWVSAQGGRVGTTTSDLRTCFARFRAQEASGQPSYQLHATAKPEMLRIPAPIPAVLPQSFDRPGEYFLHPDMPIATTPPLAQKGVAWIGIRWQAPCDLDLHTRATPNSPWLNFSSVRTSEGAFAKDYVTATGDSQFEYVSYTVDVDLNSVEAQVNLYSCDGSVQPEGMVRVWFAGKVYQAPFKLGAKTGNQGARPMAAPYWARLDLRKVVGLVRE
jgi:hypothetical protein